MEALFHGQKDALEMNTVDDQKPAFKDIQVSNACEEWGFRLLIMIVYLVGRGYKAETQHQFVSGAMFANVRILQ